MEVHTTDDDLQFEEVKECVYLGALISGTFQDEKEINMRVAAAL